MSSRRMNVLIYASTGATINAVRHATYTLRRLLGPNYAIITVTAEQILKEPWTTSCALLVMPGGADMAYCRALNGAGNLRIKQFVQMGGAYLGLCAGGYYGSAKCEFEVGKRGMEVVGERELGFFPGVCRGLAFPGFVYASEAGARAVDMVVEKDGFGAGAWGTEGRFRSYYNGGGVFADAAKFKDRGVDVLARYTEDLAVDPGEGGAAVVLCKVGDGKALLTGPHPEFAGVNLDRNQTSNPDYPKIVDALIADDKSRIAFLKACLKALGLEVSDEATPVPSLSRLHLSSPEPSDVAELLQSWQDNGVITKSEDGLEYIRGENDTFLLEKPNRWSMSSLASAVEDSSPKSEKKTSLADSSAPSSPTPKAKKETKKPQADDDSSVDRILDYNAVLKQLVPHELRPVKEKETPYFNHASFFSNLASYKMKHQIEAGGTWGQYLLYGEVVTSTNTLLEKNVTWLNHLPNGFVATATTQVAGRGRGSNVWVSPSGSLLCSVVLRHSLALSSTAPVVFVQYIAALAIVAGIKAYDKGYERLPVKLKWPNDVYALDLSQQKEAYTKMCGILVNSSYSGGDYSLVVGIGINVNNSRPSVSLSQLARAYKLPGFSLEKLLASILTHFEELYARFRRTGFDLRLQNLYYEAWLHHDQIVTLEAEKGARARIKGITPDFGLLVVEELGWEDRPTGRKWELQSDSNSFDFFKGLLRRKTYPSGI